MNMTEAPRLPYWAVAADATETLRALNTYLKQRGALKPEFIDLFFLRGSRFNLCHKIARIDPH
jgi:hypothetical protein